MAQSGRTVIEGLATLMLVALSALAAAPTYHDLRGEAAVSNHTLGRAADSADHASPPPQCARMKFVDGKSRASCTKSPSGVSTRPGYGFEFGSVTCRLTASPRRPASPPRQARHAS